MSPNIQFSPVQVPLLLSPELLAALHELAVAEGIPLSLLVTLLVRDGLDRHRGRTC
jgi:hypothetical protein